MRHFKSLCYSISIFLIVLLLANCSKDKSATSLQPETVIPSKSSNAAQPFQEKFSLNLGELNAVVFSECYGEPWQVTSGILNIDVHGVINNNSVSFTEHFYLQNFSAVRPSTGQVYHGSGGNYIVKNNQHFNNGVYILHEVGSGTMVTAGGNSNDKWAIEIHTTINANGTVSASFDNLKFTCGN